MTRFSVWGGWKKGGLKEKLLLGLGILAIFSAVIGATAWITDAIVLQERNAMENRLLQKIGTENIASIRCVKENQNLNVFVEFQPVRVGKIHDNLYDEICMAVRHEVLTGNQYKNVQKIEIACEQNREKQAAISSSRIAENRNGKTALENRFNHFLIEEAGGKKSDFSIIECKDEISKL